MTKEIQVGLSIFTSTDYLEAVQDELTCYHCKHCQLNKNVPSRVSGHHCYHKDLVQNTLSGEQAVVTPEGHLCNLFEKVQ